MPYSNELFYDLGKPKGVFANLKLCKDTEFILYILSFLY